MLHKLITLGSLCLSSLATAGSIELSLAESEPYQGFSRLQHQHLQISDSLKDMDVTVNVDNKKYTQGQSGISVELMLAKTWSDSIYSLTRAAMANDTALFTTNALYNEVNLKLLKQADKGIDIGLGLGTREFPVGQESFVAFGPSFALAKVGVWLRREQSLDGGGYRHSASAVWYPINSLRLEVSATTEEREKFILPTQSVSFAKMSNQRYNIKAAYQFNARFTGLLGLEDVEQKRDDLNSIIYAPTTWSIGLATKI